VPAQRATIQAGIDAASTGDVVLVAPGTYVGEGNRNLRFHGKAITVRSTAGPATCFIDAQYAARVFVFDTNETAASRLEGFTIERGQHASAGGGVYIAGSPTIASCIIQSNRTSAGQAGSNGVAGGPGGHGGGVYVASGAPAFFDCTLTDNLTGQGGAGFINQSGTGGSAGGNGGSGAGMYIATAAAATLWRCIVSDNVTGAGGLGGSSVICIVPPIGCQTYGENGGNGGDGAGIFLASAPGAVQVLNCLFTGNRTGGGGAAGAGLGTQVHGRGGNGACWTGGIPSSSIVNCTFYGNQVAAQGGAGQPAGSAGVIMGAPSVANSILWGNGPGPIAGGATVSYSDVQGGAQGTGNIDSNPFFADATGGDLHLTSPSPCIDAGNNAALPAGATTDLEGRPRVLEGNGDMTTRVDQGAYEYAGPTDAPDAAETAIDLRVSAEPAGWVRISYRIAAPATDVRLGVFDVAGRLLLQLVRGPAPAGEHVRHWDRRSDSGRRVARGVYWVELRAGEKRVVRRLVLRHE
jgi:hypothetical protein